MIISWLLWIECRLYSFYLAVVCPGGSETVIGTKYQSLEHSFDTGIDGSSQIGSGEVPDEEFVGHGHHEAGIRRQTDSKHSELVPFQRILDGKK